LFGSVLEITMTIFTVTEVDRLEALLEEAAKVAGQ